jgi:xanthine dehydrogenase accessory factor
MILQLAADLVAQGKPCALVTVIRTTGSVPRRAGSKMLVGPNAELLSGTIGGGEMESRALNAGANAISTGQASTLKVDLINPASGDPGVCGGVVELFVEPLLSAPTLVVIGAGHVGKALVHLSKWCGLRAVLMDDRPELCTPDAAPGADVYLPGPLSAALAQVQLNPRTCIALVTRGFPIDVNVLPALLASPVAYIGVIGSKRRWATAKESLLQQGISEADLARVHAPIGIEIGAETPEEIAVSIIAEVIATLRKQH